MFVLDAKNAGKQPLYFASDEHMRIDLIKANKVHNRKPHKGIIHHDACDFDQHFRINLL